MIIVAVIGIVLAVGVPNIIRSRDKAQRDTCIANLRQIESAMHQWATSNNKSDGDAVALSDLGTYMKLDRLPVCPGGGTYTVTVVGTVPTCSLSASGHSY